MAITNTIGVDDIAVEIHKDMRTFTDVISTRLSHDMEQKIIKKVADDIIYTVFGGASKDEVEALMHVLLNDPDIRSKMAAYRAKQRMGIDT